MEFERLEIEPMAPTTAVDILDKGKQILDQRGEEYETDSSKERSFPQVAIAFNAITGHEIKGSEVALMLQILKDVRQWSQDRLHEDSIIDCTNYSALKGQELFKEYSK